jgi:hypothetical protein
MTSPGYADVRSDIDDDDVTMFDHVTWRRTLCGDGERDDISRGDHQHQMIYDDDGDAAT